MDERVDQRMFESRADAPAVRAERWMHACAGLYDSVRKSAIDEVVESRTWPLGRVIVSRIVDHGLRAQGRSQAGIRRDQLDHYRVVLVQERVLRSDNDGVRCVVEPGQVLFTDLARPESHEADGSTTLAMFVPRAAVDSLLPKPVDLHGWMPQGAAALLLGDHLRSLVQAAPMMTVGELPAYNLATLQLLAAAIAPSVHTLGAARPVLERAQKRQAKRFIQEHLTHPDLSVDMVAAALHVSRATLYRWFEAEGGIAQYIRQRRLLRAHAQLAGTVERVSLKRLADDMGFNGAAQFSRAFRAQFGYSPSEVREAAVASVPSALVKEAGPRNFTSLIRQLS